MTICLSIVWQCLGLLNIIILKLVLLSKTKHFEKIDHQFNRLCPYPIKIQINHAKRNLLGFAGDAVGAACKK